MGISSNPANINLMQASKFLLAFDRLPDMTYFCTEANLPGVAVGNATQVTPGVNAPVPGNKFQYSDFVVKFLINEDLRSWTEIVTWLKGTGFPESSDQYANLPLQQRLLLQNEKPQYSDATLLVLSNKNNPILQIRFTDVFPVSVTGIDFDTKLSAQTIIDATATFKFTSYDINYQV